MKNPFEVNTPEGISAQDAYDLFVDVFSDFYQVRNVGHTFLNGSRGSGKSMMFRYMRPDCQKLVLRSTLKELDYFAFYVPIKLTDINYPELEKLKITSVTYLNEHLLVTYVAIKCFNDLLGYEDDIDGLIDDFELFYNDLFLYYTQISGHDVSSYKTHFNSSREYVCQMVKILNNMFIECKKYCKDLLLNQDDRIPIYNKSLCTYIDFLYPILLELKQMSFMPANKPIYILIDDAGYLNEMQTMILNTWVSYRMSHEISLKISTQLDYKNSRTVTNKTIDSPHDFSQVDISSIYTSKPDNYYKRIDDIVKRRLNKYLNIGCDSNLFFPIYKKQEIEIAKEAEKLKRDHFNPDKDYAAGDAARRYAASEYMKKLKASKAGSKYNYAGFDNLVAVSSGIVRHFLEPASKMYASILATGITEIKNIPPSIQNEIINTYSEDFLTDEFTKIHEEHGKKDYGEKFSKADKLYNLIMGLGGLFHLIFISDKSERVVFSVALTDNPDDELKEILHLAVHYGYLHKSSIGNKQGTGKCALYVLSRTLAPYFKIEPKGFKGYQFMSAEVLKLSLHEPQKFIEKLNPSEKSLSDYGQLKMF